MGYCFGWGAGNYIGGFWWILPLISWGLIIFGVVYLFRTFSRKNENGALKILKREYAMGRISQEEYFMKKKDLENR